MNAPQADRASILRLLSERLADVRTRYGVKTLSLFGSAARDELRPDSDIDVLVEFDGPANFSRYFGLKDELEALFGRRVDLVTLRGLKPRARRFVEEELIRVA